METATAKMIEKNVFMVLKCIVAASSCAFTDFRCDATQEQYEFCIHRLSGYLCIIHPITERVSGIFPPVTENLAATLNRLSCSTSVPDTVPTPNGFAKIASGFSRYLTRGVVSRYGESKQVYPPDESSAGSKMHSALPNEPPKTAEVKPACAEIAHTSHAIAGFISVVHNPWPISSLRIARHDDGCGVKLSRRGKAHHESDCAKLPRHRMQC